MKDYRLEQFNQYLKDYRNYEDSVDWYSSVTYDDYILFGESLEYVEDVRAGRIYGYNQPVEYSDLITWLESDYTLSVYEIAGDEEEVRGN